MGGIAERIYGMVFFGIGVCILWQGRDLTVGGFRSPGSGLFPTLIAVIMLVLSVLLMIFPPKKEGRGQSVSARSAVRISVVFVALLLYAFLLETFGFLIVSFVLTSLLFVAFGSGSYWRAILKGAVFTGLAYALFEILLKSNLPHGPIGF
jgi:hypothetical protein